MQSKLIKNYKHALHLYLVDLAQAAQHQSSTVAWLSFKKIVI